MSKATAVAGSNIALVKYWGQRDPALHLPFNGSISLTLDSASTTTTVAFSTELEHDTLCLDGQPAAAPVLARVAEHLDRVRALAGERRCARLESRNSFPTGAGIASSASGFAALTLAACAALGLSPSTEELSRLARLASGSACRSIFGGFVEWLPGSGHADSYARPLAPPEHWDLLDVVAVVSEQPKAVSSLAGHRLAPGSPFFSARLAALDGTLAAVRAAILGRDFAALGALAEAEALSMHAVMLTSQPPLLYWTQGTLALLRAVPAWRQEGLPAYFTLDAGPNVHVLTLPTSVEAVLDRLQQVAEVRRTIVCHPGGAARLVAAHLF